MKYIASAFVLNIWNHVSFLSLTVLNSFVSLLNVITYFVTFYVGLINIFSHVILALFSFSIYHCTVICLLQQNLDKLTVKNISFLIDLSKS